MKKERRTKKNEREEEKEEGGTYSGDWSMRMRAAEAPKSRRKPHTRGSTGVRWANPWHAASRACGSAEAQSSDTSASPAPSSTSPDLRPYAPGVSATNNEARDARGFGE